MLPNSAAQTMEKLQRVANPSPRVSLTELSRSTKWREDMIEYAIVELCDHNETAGYLVSPQGMQDILSSLEQLQRELEEAQLAAIIAQRGANTTWETGDILAERTSAILAEQETA